MQGRCDNSAEHSLPAVVSIRIYYTILMKCSGTSTVLTGGQLHVLSGDCSLVVFASTEAPDQCAVIPLPKAPVNIPQHIGHGIIC